MDVQHLVYDGLQGNICRGFPEADFRKGVFVAGGKHAIFGVKQPVTPARTTRMTEPPQNPTKPSALVWIPSHDL